ncbi:protein vein isoform X3, partial [Vespula squamosa]
ARSYVVRTQGLNSEVTRQSKASMQNEGIAAPKSALAQRRHTATPKKRTQNPTQKYSTRYTKLSAQQRTVVFFFFFFQFYDKPRVFTISRYRFVKLRHSFLKTEHNDDEISLDVGFPHKNIHLFIAGYSHV